MTMSVITPKEMRLRDVVEMLDSEGKPYGSGFTTCMVINITDSYVELFRPYGQTADWSGVRGVIPYIGIEKYKVYFSQTGIRYRLISRLPCR